MSGRLDAPGWCPPPPDADPSVAGEWDRFAALVAQVAADPDNAYNVDRYRWVLDEPPPRACAHCGDLFWPGESFDGGPARGRPRRYCSRGCACQAGWDRYWARVEPGVAGWGSAA